MKARQAKKIMRQGNGGRRSQFNMYWYARIAATLFRTGWHDHRVCAAMRRTKYNRAVEYTINDDGTITSRQTQAEYIGQ